MGTRKLLSAIERLASSSRHAGQLEANGTVGVLCKVLRERRADARGACHALDAVLHMVLWERAKRKVDFSDVLLEAKRYANDENQAVRCSARMVAFAVERPHAIGAGVRQAPQARGGCSVVLSFHPEDMEMAQGIRSGLQTVGVQVLSPPLDDSGPERELREVVQSAGAIVVCVSRRYRSSAFARLITTVATYAVSSVCAHGWRGDALVHRRLATMSMADGDDGYDCAAIMIVLRL